MGNGKWPKVFGKKLPIESDAEFDLVPGVGVNSTRQLTGLRKDVVDQAFNYYNAGFHVTVRRQGDGPTWTMIASAEGDPNNPEAYVDTHELHGSVLSRSVFTSPVLKSKFTGTEEERIKKILFVANLVENARTGKIDATAQINASTLLTAAEKPIAVKLFQSVSTGVDSYYVFSFAYRHTFNFGPFAKAVTNVANVGRFFTLADLRRLESIPANFNLPPNSFWMKIFPVAIQQLGQRKQLIYEYWGAEDWNDLAYEAAAI